MREVPILLNHDPNAMLGNIEDDGSVEFNEPLKVAPGGLFFDCGFQILDYEELQDGHLLVKRIRILEISACRGDGEDS